MPKDRLPIRCATSNPAQLAAFHGIALTRRDFVQALGAGLLVIVSPRLALGQRAQRRGEDRPQKVSARVHIGKDGQVTVMTGKVEAGQGARAELTQAAGEELRVSAD